MAARFATLAISLTLATSALVAPASAQAPHVAIVPVPGENVGPDVGRPILEAVRGALTVAVPSARFEVAGDEALVSAFAACADASCRGELVTRAGGYAVVLVHLDRPDPQGPIALRIEPFAVPSGEALSEAAEIQLPAATLTNPAAAQAVLGAIVQPVAAALPPAPPAPPEVARVLVAVNTDRAQVTVDGEVVGETPLAPLELEPGTHALAVRATGFQTYSRSIEVPAEGLRIDVFLDPTPDQAAEIARRDAAAADAYAEGEPAGEWYEQWWVWAAVGGGAVVVTALIVGIALAVGGGDAEQEGYPVPPIPTGGM